jgi:hypothetical protein
MLLGLPHKGVLPLLVLQGSILLLTKLPARLHGSLMAITAATRCARHVNPLLICAVAAILSQAHIETAETASEQL